MIRTGAQASERVLLLAPTEADAVISASILGQAGLDALACETLEELESALDEGAGAILLTEEVLSAPDAVRLVTALNRQPAWSDIPAILLSTSGMDSPNASFAMESLGNVTVLERPVRVSTLVSALRTAIRSRRRQYELRDQIVALSRSEDRFHLVARTVHESIWDLDLVSGRFWSSESMRPLFGRGEDADASFDAWVNRRHPEDAERVAASFKQTVDGDESDWSEEYRFRRADGSYVEIIDRAHILRDAAGKATRVVGALLDVSERKRAEEARALHTAIVESSQDAIVSKTLQGIILSWNAGAQRLFGWTASEAVGRSIGIIIPPGRQDEEVEFLQRVRRGERIEHFETVRRHKDGRDIVISLSLSPVLDATGRIVGASKVARDITAKRSAENTMRKQEQRLRHLLEAASILLTTDEATVMMRALFSQIGGHLQLDAYAHWRTDDTGAVRLESSLGIPEKALAELADLPIESDEEAGAILGLHGLPAFARTPLVADGRMRGVVLFASRRNAAFDPDELEFLRTICHYVTAAGERVRLIHRLRDTDRRKDEFLATLAHELRNPLAPVRSSLEIMRLAMDDPGLIARARETMERQMVQMVRLIDDLLDVSRITRGRLELRKEPVSLDALIRTALETAGPLIDDSGHRLIVDGLDRPIEMIADPVRLAQVLSNLLNNAAKYTEPGGTIHLITTLEGDEVALTVKDSGVGISEDALPGVFDLFNQVDRTLERSQGGLGIGLTLVKRLVEMHGGRVEAHSDGPGQGAAFTVRLPVIAGGASTATPSVRRVPRAAPGGRKILIADDNRDAAESMALVLRMIGNDVRTVNDGMHAVEEAEAFAPDVVLLDIGMPLLNGYDAARRMREATWGQDLVLVALTGWGQDDDKKKAIEAGFDFHFTKPLEPADLRRIVGMTRAGDAEPQQTNGSGAAS
jgi:PAS domain S-box-containing protein